MSRALSTDVVRAPRVSTFASVVFSAQARRVAVGHLRRTNTRNLVRRDRHSHTGPTHENASVALSRGHAFSDTYRIVWVVHRRVGRRSEVVILEVAIVEGLLDPRLELDTRVI